ncbi:MAG: peptidase M19 [Gammaproteobacteria bacterium]|nr:peptidase M19 [Gammaproteobacteria bacterium]
MALICVALVILVLSVLRFAVLPHYDRTHNSVLTAGPYPTSEKNRSVHHNAFVADLHADSLLWGRDLNKRHKRGQVDLPRLRDGGVDLQVFSVVTKVPESIKYSTYGSDSDNLPLLFVAAWRHPRSWFSPMARAIVQANELKRLTASSSFSLVLHRDDLHGNGIKGLLALEGMQALEGQEQSLLELHTAGYRMMGLTHFFDNEIAGSSFGVDQYGLTDLGRRLIPRMEKLGITIDLAHASTATFSETLTLATKPVVVSHGGVHGTCPGPRNLTDSQLRGLAENGGVIGIGYWKTAVCDASLHGIVTAIRYAIKIAGIDHVGLGSDFDGHVTTPFDTTGLPMLTEALFADGFSETEVEKVLGGNVLRLLSLNLPK